MLAVWEKIGARIFMLEGIKRSPYFTIIMSVYLQQRKAKHSGRTNLRYRLYSVFSDIALHDSVTLSFIGVFV